MKRDREGLTAEQRAEAMQMYDAVLEKIYRLSAEGGVQLCGVKPQYSLEEAKAIGQHAARLCLAAVKELELAV